MNALWAPVPRPRSRKIEPGPVPICCRRDAEPRSTERRAGVSRTDAGRGACEAVFGQKLRIVKLLLTVLFMIFGVAFSFWVIGALGFKLSGS